MKRFFAFLIIATRLSFSDAQTAPPLAPQGVVPPPQVSVNVIAVDSEKTAKAARVFNLTDTEQAPDDFWAQSEYGDLILQNDFSNFIFGAIPENRDPSQRLRPGSVIDIFTSPSAPENFQVFKPTIHVIGSNPTVFATAMDSTVDEKIGSATVTVLAEDQVTTETAVDTTYEMRKGWPGVLVTTTVTNESKVEKTIDAFADHVGWGAMGTFVSGQGWLNRQGTIGNNEFCFFRLYDSLIYLQPVSGQFEYLQTEGFGIAVYQRDIKLAPGESKSYQRWLLTGQKDPSKLYEFVLQQKGPNKFGYIAGQMLERTPLPDGKYIDTGVVANAEVRLTVIRRSDLPTDRYLNKPYLYTFTDAKGNYQFCVPEGEYLVTPFKSSRVYTPPNLATRAGKPNTVVPLDLLISKPSTVVYEIVDAETQKVIPGKISFLPLRGTAEADFGYPGALESGPTVLSTTGRGVIEAPLGQYRVVASHGTEYHSKELRVKVDQLKSETVRFELKRAYKTDGWISADIGVLTDKSPQSRITPRDRVASALAEGVDWIVTADAGVPTDLQPVVDEMGVADQLRASRGFRLGSTRDKRAGEFLLFPVESCSTGTTPDFSKAINATTWKDAISGLRALCPNSVLVMHRPLFPQIGLLTIQGYNTATQAFPDDANLDFDVDAFQLWEGKREGLLPASVQAWLQLAAHRDQIVPVGYSLSTGTHNEEVGYPRMYIRSSQSDPRKFDLDELARTIKQGKVLITNGPFIELKVNGVEPGDIVTAKDKMVELDLKVYTPNWANVSSITINMNGALSRKIMLPPGSVDAESGQVYPNPASGKADDEKIKLQVTKDCIMTVVVEGDPALPQDPVNPYFVPVRDPNISRGQYSYAFAQPVFIDGDGDGLVKPEIHRTGESSAQQVPAF
ncbi:hypothetical protein IT570_13080 [Candidatus Sumerlaeota bacterium]|nr:hypothetical protein [Candidatus Sumerlaeota bacterium]